MLGMYRVDDEEVQSRLCFWQSAVWATRELATFKLKVPAKARLLGLWTNQQTA